jgi:hypothetical protein
MCALLITDRSVTQDEMHRLSIAVHAIDANVVMIAAGALQDSQGLRALIGTPALHCFLPKPISPQLTRLAIESARREYLERSAPIESALPPWQQALESNTTVASESTATRTYTPPKPAMYIPGNLSDVFEDETDWPRLLRAGGMVVAGIVLTLLIGYGVYSLRHLSIFQQSDHLELAQQAIDEGRYFEPTASSALFHYQQVLSRDPKNQVARDGVRSLTERLVTNTEQALLDDRFNDAALTIEQLKLVEPSHSRLTYLQSQLQKLRTVSDLSRNAHSTLQANRSLDKPLNTQSSTSPTAASNNEMERKVTTSAWMQSARERMNQGKLVSPETDSAESYLRQIARVDPNNLSVQQMLKEIGVILVNDARRALDAKQLARARTLLNDAERFEGTATSVAELRQQIDNTESSDARTTLFNLVMRRTRENFLLEPDRDSARYYLDQLTQIDPQGADVEQARRAVALKLIDNASQAMSQQQFNMAVRLLNEARTIGYRGDELTNAEQRLRTARNTAATSIN